jgi:hypothetical protein
LNLINPPEKRRLIGLSIIANLSPLDQHIDARAGMRNCWLLSRDLSIGESDNQFEDSLGGRRGQLAKLNHTKSRARESSSQRNGSRFPGLVRLEFDQPVRGSTYRSALDHPVKSIIVNAAELEIKYFSTVFQR